MFDLQTLFYLIPYLVAIITSGGIALYAWRRRAVAGALPLAIWTMGDTLRSFGFFLVLTSPTLEGKIFWDNFHLLGGIIPVIATIFFAFQYTDRKLSHPKRTLALLSILPAIFMLLVLTDGLHGLVRANARFFPHENLPGLVYDYTLPLMINILYGYGLVFAGIALLIVKAIRSHWIYRAQVATIIIGLFLPMSGLALTLTNVIIYRASLAFFIPAGNLIIAWGLFRYRLFDIVPVAHHAVFESMTDAVIVLDSQRRVVDFNPAARRLIDRLSPGAIGQSTKEVFTKWPDLVERFDEIDELHTVLETETDEGLSHQDVNISPLYDNRGRLIGRLIVVRDITAYVQAEEEVTRYAAELEAANKELEAFSYSVSHDLRAPLRAVRGFSEILLKNYHDMLGKEGQDYLQHVLDAGQHMEELIEDLLRLSRVTRSEMVYQKINLSVLAKDILADLQQIQPKRRVEFFIETELNIDGDERLLRIMLENLLGNAWKFTRKQDHAKIEFGVTEIDRGTAFYIRDNGVGFNMEYANKIFNVFQRLHSSSEFEGSGIGLATVQRIVRMHGGRVWAESKKGAGATFYFTL